VGIVAAVPGCARLKLPLDDLWSRVDAVDRTRKRRPGPAKG
jgi:hypothetical protein